ncbi:MAG: sugar transferase [Clostridia bacterium]|nr:sugar transferase [Clostridia bacterium]
MLEFLNDLISTWWGITLICVLALILWVLLSALLYRVFFKRFYDIVLSGLAIIVLSPVLLLLIVLGAIKMKGNPFFYQLRPGKINKKTGEEKIFKLIKFRTMTCEKDENGNLLPDEKRLTRYGKILRSTSLDELPELINVFIGQMSLIGPRPLLVKDKAFMSEEIRKRHLVRGGITGLAQVSGRNNISWTQKFEYDLEYIKKITLWKDIKILFLTVFKVLKRSDIEREGTVSDIDYGDWLLQEGLISSEEYEEKTRQGK